MRAQLNRQLYFECKKHVKPGWGDEDEAWRIVRESAVMAVTERTQPIGFSDYERCTDYEIRLCIAYLQDGELPGKKYPKPVAITPAQKRKLHSIAMECGLYYANWETAKYCNTNTGEIYPADVARAHAYEAWRKNKLYGALSKHIYTNWINPHLHKFLKEGGYRVNNVKATYYFDWHKLTSEEASYLIKRFTRIYSELVERYATPINAPLGMVYSDN